jgi:hypothetical protein
MTKELLGLIRTMLVILRDNQTEVECTEKQCICNKFDHVLDKLDELIKEF